MRSKGEYSTIEVSKATRDKLRKIHRFGDTYDSIISELCDTSKESLKNMPEREGYRNVAVPGMMYTQVCMADLPGMSSFLNGLNKMIRNYNNSE